MGYIYTHKIIFIMTKYFYFSILHQLIYRDETAARDAYPLTVAAVRGIMTCFAFGTRCCRGNVGYVYFRAGGAGTSS